MIEQLKGFSGNVLAFAGRGRITRQDYETVLIPAVDAAFKVQERARLYYEIAPDFKGMEAGAILDDAKVGASHLGRWDRIALVTDVAWIGNAARAFGFFMPGQVKVFDSENTATARAWINAA